MKANANPIVLKSNRISDECIGTVRLTPEAEKSSAACVPRQHCLLGKS